MELVIGHRKADHGMKRNELKGSAGDAVLSVAGFNIRWLLRAIAAKDIKLFLLWPLAAVFSAVLARTLLASSSRTSRLQTCQH